MLDPNLLVISEEFGDWEESKRRIDLLAVDREAKLVVIELKRTESGGHMELQALRYAAMVSTMTFRESGGLLPRVSPENEAATTTLRVIYSNSSDGRKPDEERFAQDVRMILASAGFSKELTTAVMWLNQRDLDIRCIRLQPYSDGDKVSPRCSTGYSAPRDRRSFKSQVREKAQRERRTRIADNRDLSRYDVADSRDRKYTDLCRKGGRYSSGYSGTSDTVRPYFT